LDREAGVVRLCRVPRHGPTGSPLVATVAAALQSAP
jgi:hypothetical protein